MVAYAPYIRDTLKQRRFEDERASRRCWPQITRPTNILQHPGDPSATARENAREYVRASRVEGEDYLAPTDIFSIMYYGLGLTPRPLDCSAAPSTLGVHYCMNRDLYLDSTLFTNPPLDLTVLNPAQWRQAVDASPLGRFLIAWSCAVYLTDPCEIPLMLHFLPVRAHENADALRESRATHYNSAMHAVMTLLAPADRLWQQIEALGWQIDRDDPNWRQQVRAQLPPDIATAATATPSDAPMCPTEGAVSLFLSLLADLNKCPQVVIESQLDSAATDLDWFFWEQRLVLELPALAQRQAIAAKEFVRTEEAHQQDGIQPTIRASLSL